MQSGSGLDDLATAPTAEQLTLRECQILGCRLVGHSQKLIACTLGISTSAVSANMANTRRKLGVTSRGQLAAMLGWRQAPVGALAPGS